MRVNAMKSLIVLIFCATAVYGQTWEGRGRVLNHDQYFSKVMQETILEVERKGFCNLKLDDIVVTMNEQMYDWLVSGNVTYTNGFLISIEKIDVTNMEQSVGRRLVDEVQTPFGIVRGRLNLRDAKIGFDVIPDLVDEENRRYTGVFTHTLIQFQFEVVKNLLTNEIATTPTLTSLSGGLTTMVYMPANKVTEVLSRRYVPGSNWDSIRAWGTDMFAPIILDVAKNKVEFPRVCFNTEC